MTNPAAAASTNVATGTGTGNTASTTSSSATNNTTNNNGDVSDDQNGPLANAGDTLIAVYLDYQKFVDGGGKGTFTTSQSSTVEIVGTSVGVDVHGTPGSLASLQGELASLGMQIQGTDSNTTTVEGLLPIAQLINAAQLSDTVGINPIYTPKTG
jgi:hypothetical protein